MKATTEYKHIQLNDRGQVIIEGSTMKVTELIMSRIAYGWSAEEMHFQYPFLTMSQIHSALSYYWDNKTEMDTIINTDLQTAEMLKDRAGETPFVARLKAQGLKP